MKILLYIEKSDVCGGIEVFAERHALSLREKGHEVAFVSSFPLPDDFDEIVVHKCSDVTLLEKFPAEKTLYFVHDHEPICPRTYAYTPLGNNCSRSGGFWPCILCAPLCRRPRAALARVFRQRRRKRAMAAFKGLVVISEFMKRRLVANGFAPDKITVERPLLAPIPSPAPAACDVPKDVDILYAGQLIRGKGVHLLLEAMARMKTRRTLDIVGAGNMAPRLVSLASSLGLSSRVRFRGFRSDVHEWMRRAKTVVVPSFWQEPFGLVAAEAAALGKKVVVFAIGGLPEAAGPDAALVPPGDVQALAEILDATN